MATCPDTDILAPGPQHAGPAADLWCRSIEHLCGRDHQGRPEILATWTSNKTVAHLSAAFADPALCWWVARDTATGTLAGIALLGPDPTLRALYVDPDFVGRGIGRLLLRTAETAARTRGDRQLTLESTETAHAFYQAQGYRDSGPRIPCCGVPAWPMVKVLGADTSSPSAPPFRPVVRGRARP